MYIVLPWLTLFSHKFYPEWQCFLDSWLPSVFFFRQKTIWMCKETTFFELLMLRFLIFVCTVVLYEYMQSLGNDMHSLSHNTHVQINIYREFYHWIVYIANEFEGSHIIIFLYSTIVICPLLSFSSKG
jgi:hypothetical protein